MWCGSSSMLGTRPGPPRCGRDHLFDVAVVAITGGVALELPGSVLFDFTNFAYINSTGIALIISVLARPQRRTVVATGPSEHYRQIFDITRRSDFFEVCAHSDGAAHRVVESGGSGPPTSMPTSGGDWIDAPVIAMDVRQVGDSTAVVDTRGELTSACEYVLMSAYDVPGGIGARRLVRNFAGHGYMNRGGIGMIVTHWCVWCAPTGSTKSSPPAGSTSTTARSSSRPASTRRSPSTTTSRPRSPARGDEEDTMTATPEHPPASDAPAPTRHDAGRRATQVDRL